MLKVRFAINKEKCENDYRPIKWPIRCPYWCTGENEQSFILVAYVSNIDELMELWPEADEIDPSNVDKIVFTDRFTAPGWWHKDQDV